jgi:hypothetical protein
MWGLLGMQATVFLAVTIPLFRSIQVSAGESDARSAVRLIARELAALPSGPPANLAAWMREQPELQHRLTDMRIAQSSLEYHGYEITWVPNAKDQPDSNSGHGILWAIPIRDGKTGRTRFHLRIQ